MADDDAPDSPEIRAALTVKHDRIERANAAKYRKLHEDHGIVIPRESIEGKRMEFILDWLFPPGEVDRLELEVGWQEWLARQLEDVHAQVLEAERQAREEAKRPKLLLPDAAKAGGLVVPGAG